MPAPDGVDRTAYIPTPVEVTSPPPGTDNVIVRFWYQENNGYCGSRAEDCFAVSSTIPQEPFKYPSDGAGGVEAGITGISCASGCKVAVPGTTGHVLYYQVKFRDANNATLSSSAVNLAVIP